MNKDLEQCCKMCQYWDYISCGYGLCSQPKKYDEVLDKEFYPIIPFFLQEK